VIIGATLSIGIRVRSSIWWRDGWKWVVVCDAVVITTGTPWAFTVEEGSGQLIERVVEKIALVGSANYPLLTKINYNQWSPLMKIKPKARGLWSAVDPGDIEF
jgi:hypothetical protein